jgi:hypothetical protein
LQATCFVKDWTRNDRINTLFCRKFKIITNKLTISLIKLFFLFTYRGFKMISISFYHRQVALLLGILIDLSSAYLVRFNLHWLCQTIAWMPPWVFTNRSPLTMELRRCTVLLWNHFWHAELDIGVLTKNKALLYWPPLLLILVQKC